MPDLTDKFQTLFSNYSSTFKPTYHNGISREEFSASLPKQIGVYLITRKDNSDNNPIYIGSAGKIKVVKVDPTALKYSKQTISNRILGASTPYRVNGITNVFEYAPTTSGVPPAGYGASIPLNQIEIICMTVNSSGWFAPSALEHLLIQGFIIQFGILPVANQKI